MPPETDKPYDPEEDPDTGPARTPADVEAKAERDQAEGETPTDGPDARDGD